MMKRIVVLALAILIAGTVYADENAAAPKCCKKEAALNVQKACSKAEAKCCVKKEACCKAEAKCCEKKADCCK